MEPGPWPGGSCSTGSGHLSCASGCPGACGLRGSCRADQSPLASLAAEVVAGRGRDAESQPGDAACAAAAGPQVDPGAAWAVCSQLGLVAGVRCFVLVSVCFREGLCARSLPGLYLVDTPNGEGPVLSLPLLYSLPVFESRKEGKPEDSCAHSVDGIIEARRDWGETSCLVKSRTGTLVGF